MLIAIIGFADERQLAIKLGLLYINWIKKFCSCVLAKGFLPSMPIDELFCSFIFECLQFFFMENVCDLYRFPPRNVYNSYINSCMGGRGVF